GGIAAMTRSVTGCSALSVGRPTGLRMSFACSPVSVVMRPLCAGSTIGLHWRMRVAYVLILLAISSTLMAAPRSVRVAICQILSIDGDREGNFRRIEYALAAARGAGAAIAAFPESVILGWENPDAHRLAAPIPGADSDRTAAFGDAYVARIRAFKPD